MFFCSSLGLVVLEKIFKDLAILHGFSLQNVPQLAFILTLQLNILKCSIPEM
jgi:hypothetical protein